MGRVVTFNLDDNLDKRFKKVQAVSGVTMKFILNKGFENELQRMEKMHGIELPIDAEFANLARQLQQGDCQEGQAVDFVNNFMARLKAGEIKVEEV